MITKDNFDWYGQQANVNSDPLVDTGTGRPFIIRRFQFRFKPGLEIKPTKQQLFDQHWPQLRFMLWGDGLVANEDVTPRVMVKGDEYEIILLCEPRFGQTLIDKPITLQDAFKKKKK